MQKEGNLEKNSIEVIAHMRTDFPEKFGLPRQSGLIPELRGRVVFTPKFRDPEAIKGIEGYEYLWILWKFEVNDKGEWSPKVRPPRLGGNTYMGVFATRSPFRPNHIGLSCVRLEDVIDTEEGKELVVSGIDMKDGTPIYDIKPYLPYADAHPEARYGFAQKKVDYELSVEFSPKVLGMISPKEQQILQKILAQDPRPSYQNDSKRIYGLSYAGYNVHFSVDKDLLTVTDIEEINEKNE